LALWPAAGVFQYEQFTATLPEARFIEHLALVRAGTPPRLVFGGMEGMVSFPSFHLAGAWMITWALRGTRIFWPAFVLNALLTLSTFATGAHYIVDGLGTVAMGAVSLGLWRWVQRDGVTTETVLYPAVAPLRRAR
jgi:membrane-associated phospholipid phosphatase